jgi:hypothetical protein
MLQDLERLASSFCVFHLLEVSFAFFVNKAGNTWYCIVGVALVVRVCTYNVFVCACVCRGGAPISL